MSRSRDETLAVLQGQRLGRLPVFSGLPCLTATGLRAAGLRYGDVHTDAVKMAAASASTFEVYGFESAVVPFDLCVEAEALGCGVDFQSDVDSFLAPVVTEPLNFDEYHLEFDLALRAGRVRLVAEALRILKASIGRYVVSGVCVPGPFTLAWQMFGAEEWLTFVGATLAVAQHGGQGQAGQGQALSLLGMLSDFLVRVAALYREAGADFITVHEMGGSPQVIGPQTFRRLVVPALTQLFARLPSPTVLSICGDTNAVVADMLACGASALSVDHRNDLARTRRVLGDDLVLLGNFDPVATLSHGTPDDIARAVAAIADAGANAVWPGCDLYPEIPDANMRALMSAAKNLSANNANLRQ